MAKSEPACTASTSMAIESTPDDAVVAVDPRGSWLLVAHASGELKIKLGGSIKFRGGHCSAADCPLSLTSLGLVAGGEATFQKAGGGAIEVKDPLVIVGRSIDSVSSKLRPGAIPAREFLFPAGSLQLFASGSVAGKRYVVGASNPADSSTGELRNDGVFKFESGAEVDGFKVAVHLEGRVRVWPPFLQVEDARIDGSATKRRLKVKVRFGPTDDAAPNLFVVGPSVVIPVKVRRGAVHLRLPSGVDASRLELRACRSGACVQRRLDLAATEQRR